MNREHADVIVVGAGHNGLICAAYLARAGIDTLLLESRTAVGGCASTVTDLDARFNICNCDHSMVRAMPIIDELDLTGHGLRYLEPEISAIHQFHDGSDPWVFFHDVERHLDALAVTHPSQVAGYRRYLADATPVAELALAMARTTPSTHRMLATIAGKRAIGARRLLDWSRRSMADVMAEYFDDWHMVMPAVSAGPTVWGAPHTAPGTGMAAAIYATRHLQRTGRPVGGSGALTDAARASFESAGGRVRCDSRVEHLLVRDGSVRGVRLHDGT
ncbi:MAG: NAD(P)/FAD-dependent oxidoreductase, partial [Ilumatobacteraceae bacterium]